MHRVQVLVLLLSLTCTAQTTPQLSLRVVPEKLSYDVEGTVQVRVEIRNDSQNTLCFPKPSQTEFFGPTGTLITTGRPANDSEYEEFVRHVDGSGKSGKELESAITNDWVRLKPGETYKTDSAKAMIHLRTAGTWILEAKYQPPEGSFSRVYRQELISAARKAGCTLPTVETISPGQNIQVNSAEPVSKR